MVSYDRIGLASKINKDCKQKSVGGNIVKRILFFVLLVLMIPAAAFNITRDTRSPGRRKSPLQKPAELPAGLDAEGGGGRRLGSPPDTTLLGE